MAYALTDALILFGAYNLSGDLNKVGIDLSAGEEIDTAFGDTFHSRPGGQLADCTLSVEGWWQSSASASPDPLAVNSLGVAGTTVTVCDLSTTGAAAYLLGVHEGTYTQSSEIGKVRPFTLACSGSSGAGAIRGRLLLPVTTVTGNSNGTGFQLGAVSASQYVFIAIHVLTAGTTADIIVESDDNASFISATTRSTTTVTTTGAPVVIPVAGAITDDYWRVRTANVTGTFSVAVAVGIK